jgi:hypothetical protein
MSNASAPLLSLGDSLFGVGQRMKPTDPRRETVLRREISAYSLAADISTDVSDVILAEIVGTTNAAAALQPSNEARYDEVMAQTKALLLKLRDG